MIRDYLKVICLDSNIPIMKHTYSPIHLALKFIFDGWMCERIG